MDHFALQELRRRWSIFAVLGLLLVFCGYAWLTNWWPAPNPQRWLLLAGLAYLYLLAMSWRSLPSNHRPGEARLLPTLGLGNSLSLGRGLILVLFCGFLFSPWPGAGWYAWLPGLLYTLAALPDYLDGWAARRSNHVTRLGEQLDMNIDSLGVLGVSLLAVQYGQVPWWYLPVGLARYLFLAGLWLRQRRGLPVYDLPFSVRRRGYAALAMGLFFVALYPLFQPPGTHLVATIFAVYILGGFLWDWLVACGRLPAQPGAWYPSMERMLVQWLPLALRGGFLVYILARLLPQFAAGPDWFGVLELGFAILLCLGCAGRLAAIGMLVILGLQQAAAPLAALVLATNLLFLGTGAGSLWQPEDALIYHRAGEAR